MVFSFEDLERIIEDGQFDGAHTDWFREIWKIVEKRGLNKRSGKFDIIRFYRLTYQLCALYFGFTNVLLDCGSPDDFLIYLDIDYTKILDSEEYDPDSIESIEDYIKSLITENSFSEVREMFSGVSRSVIFASLYYCLNYEDFSFDEDKVALDEILNDVDGDKMTAYEWLCGELGN